MMMRLLGFCQLAIVSGVGANFFANLALANSLGGDGSLSLTGNGLTDAFLLSGGFGGGRGINGALSTAVTANALGGLGGSGNNGLLTAAVLANGGFGNNNGNGNGNGNGNFRPAFDGRGNYYYSSSYYIPPTTSYLPTYDYSTYYPTYYPTTYLPTTSYIPPATTYLPTTTFSSTLYPDYTSYLGSPYVGLGVGSYGCWINGVWTASCYV